MNSERNRKRNREKNGSKGNDADIARPQVISWSNQFAEQALVLLNRYKETSLFLLANLRDHGPHLTDATFSGNFKCLICNNAVVGVFSFTRAGTIILQTDRSADYTNVIIDACLPEIARLKGIVAEWDLVQPFRVTLQRRFPILKETFYKKEALYQHSLEDLDRSLDKEACSDYQIRFLRDEDFQAWDELYQGFLRDTNQNLCESMTTKQERYLRDVGKKYWWGLFIEERLVSMCAYTVRVDDLAQIGGVYTTPETRGRGYGYAVIRRMILDSKNIQRVKKLILFTNEDNFIARKIYERAGFKQIGYFGLLFCEF